MNGKHGDNPLADLVTHGDHPFPPDIEEMLLQINALGRQIGRWPLGENGLSSAVSSTGRRERILTAPAAISRI